MIPWWVLSPNNFLNPLIRPMKTWENCCLRIQRKFCWLSLRKFFQKNYLKTCWLRSHCQKIVKLLRQRFWTLLVFASVSPSMSTDIKLYEVQHNISKVTWCFIKLLSQLPNILKTNENHKDDKIDAIQIVLSTQNLLSIRKKIPIAWCKQWIEGSKQVCWGHQISSLWGELEDSLKKGKGKHYSLQELKSNAKIPTRFS